MSSWFNPEEDPVAADVAVAVPSDVSNAPNFLMYHHS